METFIQEEDVEFCDGCLKPFIWLELKEIDDEKYCVKCEKGLDMNNAKYKYTALNKCGDELETLKILGVNTEDAATIIASIFAKGEKSGLEEGKEIAINHIEVTQ